MNIVDQDGRLFPTAEEREKATAQEPNKIVEDVRIETHGEELAIEMTFAPLSFRQRWALLSGGMLQVRLSATHRPQGIYAKGVGMRIITPKAWKKYRKRDP